MKDTNRGFSSLGDGEGKHGASSGGHKYKYDCKCMISSKLMVCVVLQGDSLYIQLAPLPWSDKKIYWAKGKVVTIMKIQKI